MNLRWFDLTGQPYILYFKEKTKNSTIAGSLFSISLMILLIFICMQHILDYINNSNYSQFYYFYYADRKSNYLGYNNFSNSEPLRFKNLNKYVANEDDIDLYYRLTARVNNTHYYVLPRCVDDIDSFCLDYSKLGQKLVDSLDSVNLIPCDSLNIFYKKINVLNFEELQNCTGDHNIFDNKFINNTLDLRVLTTLNSFAPSYSNKNTSKYVGYASLSHNKNTIFMAKSEILLVNQRRNDFLFGFSNYSKFFNTYSTQIITEDKQWYHEGGAFGFSYFFGGDPYSVNEYRVEYSGFLQFLASIGGMIKIMNVLLFVFKIFVTNPLIDFELFNEMYSNPEKDFEIPKNRENSSLSRSDTIRIESICEVKSSLNNNFNRDSTLKYIFCKCSNVTKHRKKIIRNYFSFQFLFNKISELNLLKIILLDKGQVCLLNQISKINSNKLKAKVIKQTLSDYTLEANNYFKTIVQPSEKDKILYKYYI